MPVINVAFRRNITHAGSLTCTICPSRPNSISCQAIQTWVGYLVDTNPFSQIRINKYYHGEVHLEPSCNWKPINSAPRQASSPSLIPPSALDRQVPHGGGLV